MVGVMELVEGWWRSRRGDGGHGGMMELGGVELVGGWWRLWKDGGAGRGVMEVIDDGAEKWVVALMGGRIEVIELIGW